MQFQIKEIVEKLSTEEKAYLMSGKNTWETKDYPEYGIPSIKLSDGPHGLRVQVGAADHLGLNESASSTCFPTAATIANSWDEKLGEQIGEALAEEAISLGVQVILGPGLNIKRSPLCGRNFEYFSEDPYLSGKMAASYIRGIQSKGVAACPKHFAVNSQELRRMANNSVLDERTLREIYLTGFEIAVKEGQAKSIMTSYNEVNGTYANENQHLLKDILVGEWGFNGMVVSDWGGSNDHALGVKNGSHLEMPGTAKSGMREILKGIEDGVISEEKLNIRVEEFLKIVFELNKNSCAIPTEINVKVHHKLAQKAAEESIVLLQNRDSILPITNDKKVLIVGEFASKPRYQGAGSSLVKPTIQPESFLSIFQQSGYHLLGYEKGYKRNSETDKNLINSAVSEAEKADIVLVFAGLDEISETEGIDRLHMRLPEAQNKLIEALANKCKNIVVVLSSGSAVEIPWKDKVKGIVHGYLGGQAGTQAMFKVLTGSVNPSGKLSESYPCKCEDIPCYKYYPGKERNSEYREAIFVGYRYYDTIEKKVNFPFGYGLSYTDFQYRDLNVTDQGIEFYIKNIGNKDGAEIAQMYVSKTSDTIFRPTKELKGFKKIYLKSGEEQKVHIPFDDKTFRFFDTRSDQWEIEQGIYTVLVGKDSRNICLQQEVWQEGTVPDGIYVREKFEKYHTGNVTNITDDEFKQLYGKELPDGSWNSEIDINDAICQFYYAKGKFARFVYWVLNKLKERSERKGKPNLNILFNYNMPIRGLSKMTNGMITREMCEAVVEMANGHGWRGFYHFIQKFLVSRKG